MQSDSTAVWIGVQPSRAIARIFFRLSEILICIKMCGVKATCPLADRWATVLRRVAVSRCPHNKAPAMVNQQWQAFAIWGSHSARAYVDVAVPTL